MKKQDNKKTKEIAETSGAAAITGTPVDSNKNNDSEKRVRSMVQNALKIYYTIPDKKLSKEKLQEERLRKIISNLLLSEIKASKEPPPKSTLEGFLREFLKAKLPSIKIQFDKLQDSDEERFGFIETFMFGVSDLFNIPNLSQEDEEQELKEEEEEKKVKMKFGAFDDLALDGEDDKEEIEKPVQKQEEPMDKAAQTEFDVGSRTGYRALQGITSAIQDLKKDIVPQNLENARSTLLRNFAGWMDQWTVDNQTITDFLAKTLQELNVEVPEQLSQQSKEVPASQPEPEQPVLEEDFLEEEIDFD